MRITVLADNNTYIDQYYLGEPAFSLYLEDEDQRLLFDAGYSDAFIRNAAALHCDLAAVDTVVVSHGHDDHSRGLQFLCEQHDCRSKRLVLHPEAFRRRICDGKDLGMPFDRTEAARRFRLTESRTPLPVSPHLTFLGAIPRRYPWENRIPIGQALADGTWQDDFLPDDSALVCQCREGLFIICGCAHAGVCNTIDYALEVCGAQPICGVLGGMHLRKDDEQLQRTIEFFREHDIKQLWPCHCVSFKAKAAIHAAIPIHEVGVGMVLELTCD